MRSLKAQYYHLRVGAEFYLKEISGRRLLSTRLDCCKSQYPRASRGRASSSSSKHPLIHVSIKFISSLVRPFSSLALRLCVSLCVCGCVNSESNPPGNVVLITEIRERERGRVTLKEKQNLSAVCSQHKFQCESTTGEMKSFTE